MTISQSDKAARFRELHRGPGAFVIPNPWDAGSARILARLGFSALATSSGASAGTLGRRDGNVTRAEALRQAMMALLDGPGFTDGSGKTQFTYAHPLFWAPYSVIGDGG